MVLRIKSALANAQMPAVNRAAYWRGAGLDGTTAQHDRPRTIRTEGERGSVGAVWGRIARLGPGNLPNILSNMAKV